MMTWELVCVDRETGAESVQRVAAPDKQAAYATAADRGLLVERVAHVSEVMAPPTNATPSPAPRRYHVGESSGTILLYIGGAGLALLGALVCLSGLVMEPDLVIAGSAMFLGGVILLATARIVGQLLRWGRPIVAYLEAAHART